MEVALDKANPFDPRGASLCCIPDPIAGCL